MGALLFFSLALAGIGMIYANETAAQNRQAQKDINAENIALAREQMDRQDAMQLQNQTWQEMMYDKSNEYNSPTNQIRRAEAAGLNPWSVFSKGGASTVASNVPQSSSSGVSYPGLPNLGVPLATDYSQFIQGLSGNVSQLAQSYKSIADAKKAGAETSQIETLLDEQLKGLSLENAQKKFNLDMDTLYTGKERNQKLMNLKSENSLLVQQALTSAQQGSLYDFEAQLKKIESNLLQSKIDKGYVDIYIDNLKREGELLSSQSNKNNEDALDVRLTRSARINSMNANADQARANARYFLSQAKTEDEMRDLKTSAQRLENKIRAIDWEVNDQTKESQIKKIIADSDLAKFMNYRERRMLDSYLASKDWERVMMVLDQVHKTVGDVQGFIPFAGGNSMGSTSNSSNGYYPSYTK